MIKEEDISIRPAEEKDAIPSTLLLQSLGLTMPQGQEINAHWRRMWNDNPYYKTFNEQIYYGWVMEYQGRMVGFFGSFPRTYYLNGKLMRIAIATQWGVEKEFRKFTYLLSDKFFHENPIATKIVTTAIRPTGKIFEKYKGHAVPSAELTTVYMIPLKIDKLMMQKISLRIKHPLLVKALTGASKLSSFPWRWHYRFTKTSPYVQEIAASDLSDVFEKFWEKYLQASTGLVASRSIENVQWFYKGGFRHLTSKLFVYTKNGEIQGYASILNEPVKDGTLIRYKLIDMLVLSADIKKELFHSIVAYCYNKGADVFEIHLPGLVKKEDIPFLTLSRKVNAWPFYFQTTDSETEGVLKNESQWSPSSYDGDVALC